MNTKKLTLLSLLILLVQVLFSQSVYQSGNNFPLIGKVSDDTETRYERLPAYLKDITRTPVWDLGKCSSGLALRFRSNSTHIAVKWDVYIDNIMNHMTLTGIKGLDLYAWEDEKWVFVNSARPQDMSSEQVIISNMTLVEREFMLYLPLYDGITDLHIGVDSTAYLTPPKLQYPSQEKPIIVYGTSITQGGCATRPGMSYTNILGRHINKEVINLGFSGNGQLDYEIAELINSRDDAGLIILDFVPNVSIEQLVEKLPIFYSKIRQNNKNIPVLFIESAMFTHTRFDKKTENTVTDKNEELKRQFENLKNSGEKNIYYLSSENLIGTDGEATVDGSHFTDLGFVRFAEILEKEVRKILND